MSKPINATVGKCECRKKGCNHIADIRRLKGHERGKRYLYCPLHKIDRGWSAESWVDIEKWIAEHEIKPEPGLEQKLEPGQEKPEPGLAPEPEKKPEISKQVLAPVPEPRPAPKAEGWDSDLSNFMEM